MREEGQRRWFPLSGGGVFGRDARRDPILEMDKGGGNFY